jgi:hypothetical protein
MEVHGQGTKCSGYTLILRPLPWVADEMVEHDIHNE